jgi:hypothetical protein
LGGQVAELDAHELKFRKQLRALLAGE